MSAPVRRLVRVAADVEPAHHARLAALCARHGVSLGAVVAAAIQAGLPMGGASGCWWAVDRDGAEDNPIRQPGTGRERNG